MYSNTDACGFVQYIKQFTHLHFTHRRNIYCISKVAAYLFVLRPGWRHCSVVYLCTIWHEDCCRDWTTFIWLLIWDARGGRLAQKGTYLGLHFVSGLGTAVMVSIYIKHWIFVIFYHFNKKYILLSQTFFYILIIIKMSENHMSLKTFRTTKTIASRVRYNVKVMRKLVIVLLLKLAVLFCRKGIVIFCIQSRVKWWIYKL